MLPDTFYHLYNHANGNENLFRNDENYSYFLKKYAQHISPVADTYAYCLMPNHIHFLIRIKSEEDLLRYAKIKYATKDIDLTSFQNLSSLYPNFVAGEFQNLFIAYAKAYNQMYNRKGSLFMRPFKRKEITHDHYFTKLIHYIHANPVHHGFCNNILDWKHSSYHALISNKASQLKRTEVIHWFGNIQEFKNFNQQPIDVKLALEMDF